MHNKDAMHSSLPGPDQGQLPFTPGSLDDRLLANSNIDDQNVLPVNQAMSRERYLQVTGAALATGEVRFARQALLNWLAQYPGDLLASLHYARALIAEERLSRAVTVLNGLCRTDPEFIEALKHLLSLASPSIDTQRQPGGARLIDEQRLQTHWFALTGHSRERQTLAAWGGALSSARQALRSGDLQQAEEMLRVVLEPDSGASDHPLALATHLQLLAQKPQVNPIARLETALHYHQRCPDCLQIMLWLAEWSMETGDADYAVALLHQAAARDIAGQVVRRLWGEGHLYRSVWPDRLELALERPVPAPVAALLGWNLLASGEKPAQPQAGQPSPVSDRPLASLDPQSSHNGEPANPGAGQGPRTQGAPVDSGSIAGGGLERYIWNPILSPAPVGNDLTSASPPAAAPVPAPGSEAVENAAEAEVSAPAARLRSPRYLAKERKAPPDREVLAVSQELDELALRSALPLVTHLDGRFPVYVIFSVRASLQKVYGAQVAALVESEMAALAQVLQKRRGWTARVFLADDPSGLSQPGKQAIQAARPGDPWDLKLALADLDYALAKDGERIGALLIVGGEEIVPFHHLPNPVDDQDQDVPSDNPYAALDDNYFIPEWPVGRLPGGVGVDARLLIDSLVRIRKYHESAIAPPSWADRLARRFSEWLGRLHAGAYRGQAAEQSQDSAERGTGRWWDALSAIKPFITGKASGRSFGYTAAVWQKAATLVFRPIGKESALRVSPPFSLDGGQAGQVAQDSLTLDGRLGYFNLHGLVDAPEWYGQRDPQQASGSPGDNGSSEADYPVALRPQDISAAVSPSSGSNGFRIPQVVFTEACYGLHLHGRPIDQAISLKFLQAGSLAVVGSTCMAYGSIGAPLVAADLLGQAFWRFLQDGMPSGEALRQAKLFLASEMHKRQGYLDGEDQKSLISFVLYGDPLAQPGHGASAPKSLRTRSRPLAEIQTICDRLVNGSDPEPVPHDVMASVRKAVAHYLPGMSDAQITFSHERAVCAGEGHNCPTHELECLRQAVSEPPRASRSLVTLSKKLAGPEGVHPRIARLTLDERGKLVKLVVSR